MLRVVGAVEDQHQPPHRIRRTTAIVEQHRVVVIALDCHVLRKRGQQVAKERDRQAMVTNDGGQCVEHFSGGRERG